jgi:hypothetical protein
VISPGALPLSWYYIAMCFRSITFLFTIAVGISTVSDGRADPHGGKTKFDFMIIDADCQMLVSVLASIPGKDAVSVVKGDAGNEMCWRKSRNVHCEYSSDSGKTLKGLDYAVRVDTAALMEMANDTASEVTYIDPSRHIAITTGRTFATTDRTGIAIPIILVKTCKSSYFTYDEVQALDSKK